MNETTPLTRNQILLFGGAFLLALALRFLNLGVLPLSDSEASAALQAFNITRNLPNDAIINPAYVNLSALSFYILTATNFTARLIPALLGSLLALAPFFLRKWFPVRAMILLSFGLAIDPGLVALSRMAGSSMIAVTCVVLAVIAWKNENTKWAGVFGGLALLGGPAFWAGALTIVLALLIARSQSNDEETESTAGAFDARSALQASAWYAIPVFIITGSIFFLSPLGLGAVFNGLGTFVSGWTTQSFVPVWRLPLAVLAYAPLALLFGVAHFVRGVDAGNRLTLRIAVWFGVGFVLALAYPNRQVQDLVWVLLPLWLLAALEMDAQLDRGDASVLEFGGMLALTLIILTFSWFNFSSLSKIFEQPTINNNLMIAGAGLAVLFISAILVSLGWSTAVARSGLMCGLMIALGLYTFSAAWSSAGLQPNITQEMWSRDPQVTQSGTIRATIEEISEWSTGVKEELPVSFMDINSPALRWMLRERLGADDLSNASFILSAESSTQAFAATYRGADFIWRRYPAWDGATWVDWLRWVSTRQIPAGDEKIILWARSDLFIDAQNVKP